MFQFFHYELLVRMKKSNIIERKQLVLQKARRVWVILDTGDIQGNFHW